MIKERVPFVEHVVTGSFLERWLSEVEVAMVMGLYALTKPCLRQYPEGGNMRTDWFLNMDARFASQVQLLIDQIFWTDLATKAQVTRGPLGRTSSSTTAGWRTL